MSKALTIEELKALKVGDWVWIKPKSEEAMCFSAGYYKISANWFSKNSYEYEHCVCFTGIEEDPTLAWSNYGTKWLAWKNKEQAETNSKTIELPCLRDIPDFVDKDGKRTKMKELNYIENERVYSIPYVNGQFEEAERRLMELKGE